MEGYKYQSEMASSLPIHRDDYLLPFAYSALRQHLSCAKDCVSCLGYRGDSCLLDGGVGSVGGDSW